MHFFLATLSHQRFPPLQRKSLSSARTSWKPLCRGRKTGSKLISQGRLRNRRRGEVYLEGASLYDRRWSQPHGIEERQQLEKIKPGGRRAKEPVGAPESQRAARERTEERGTERCCEIKPRVRGPRAGYVRADL